MVTANTNRAGFDKYSSNIKVSSILIMSTHMYRYIIDMI